MAGNRILDSEFVFLQASSGDHLFLDSKPQSEAPYENLSPDRIQDAVESFGLRSSGSILALNSYENRVYQVGIEDATPVVVKFYRPQRWSDEAILEEHAFCRELTAREIPVVAPLAGPDGRTLLEHEGFRFAVFPRQGGRAPELDNEDNLLWLGRFLGRIHMVGAAGRYRHRPTLSVQEFGHDAYQYLMAHGFIPPHIELAYRTLVEDLLRRIETVYRDIGKVRHIRLHGDCHVGNILWTEHGPHFVDLDDSRMGPPVQDLWMLLSGDRDAMSAQLARVLEGYCEFSEFDARELHLMESLRTLRMIHYAAWLARRWNDPAFPMSFPWFNTNRYWEEHILQLREQAAALDELPLPWY